MIDTISDFAFLLVIPLGIAVWRDIRAIRRYLMRTWR